MMNQITSLKHTLEGLKDGLESVREDLNKKIDKGYSYLNVNGKYS